ncbi:MAG: hypothetical protein EOO38_15630 [Cytophagaceae bacterium]|nr:MAG: hypothetical protein EOO38_15630 [Cytophagaceae bacterium]
MVIAGCMQATSLKEATSMRSQRFSKLQIFSGLIVVLFAIHYLFFRAPSEAQMLAMFHQRKAQFEQIRLMIKQDRNVEAINEKWVTGRYGDKNGNQPEGVDLHELPINISPKRIALYRARLKALGFSGVNARHGRVQLVEFSGGFTDTSWGIGYVWSAKPLTPLVKSAYYQMPGQNHWHYSRIEGNWYMFHMR